MKVRLIITSILLCISINGFAQSKIAWLININANNYFPLNNKENKPYPILWYGKSLEDKNKIMIGGVGLGVAGIYKLNEKWNIKGNINFSRRAFYDESFQPMDITAIPTSNPPVVRSEEYLINALLTAHYLFSPQISLGVGLGEQTLLNSRAVFYTSIYFSGVEKQKIKNSFYKPVILTLPIEFSWKLNRFLLTARYEQSLMSRLRGDSDEKNSFGQLFIEFGYFIRKPKTE